MFQIFVFLTIFQVLERRDSVVERISPKNVEKPAHSKEREMSPVFSKPVSSAAVTQEVESSSSKTTSLEVVETVEEMSSSSFGDNVREEQLDAIMVESMEELANTSECWFQYAIILRTVLVRA